MFYLALGLIIIGVVAMIAGFFRNRSLQKKLEAGEITELPSIKQINDMECCGQHEVCEKESLLAAVSKEIEYYNDEELDRFQGRDASDYNTEDEEEFREILYTMRDDEVAGWVRSLQLRGVNIPEGVRDEVLMIVADRRG
ncbi:MAG: phospholipase [Bacteroidaceae bacterium]|nr:phospholipase [Bacteroidaceae bacterium]